jgi:magnesium chelatase subunit D
MRARRARACACLSASDRAQVPLDVLEDRLLGSVDLEKSLATGETIFEPGLLARAHRGVLYIDDVNLLDESISNLLLAVISSGEVVVEREGLSVRYPCRPTLIATFNPEGGDLRDHLLDRIGICLSADAEPLTLEQRIDAAEIANRFSSDPDAVEAEAAETQEGMKETLVFARAFIKDVTISRAQIGAGCCCCGGKVLLRFDGGLGCCGCCLLRAPLH